MVFLWLLAFISPFLFASLRSVYLLWASCLVSTAKHTIMTSHKRYVLSVSFLYCTYWCTSLLLGDGLFRSTLYVIIESNRPNLQNLSKRHNIHAIHDLETPRYDHHPNSSLRLSDTPLRIAQIIKRGILGSLLWCSRLVV